MEKKRPIGVTVFGFLTILLPFRFYVDLIVLSFNYSVPISELPKLLLRYYISNPLVILIQIGSIILGIGLLNLKKWAMKGILIISWLGAFFGVTALFLPSVPIPLTGKIWTIAINTLYVWFFTRPKVQALFGSGGRPAEEERYAVRQ